MDNQRTLTRSQSSRLVALDWGTSSLRAYLVDADGTVLDRRAWPHGIRKVTDGDFAGTLARAIDGWDAGLPRIACGMIGSRNGWVEAPYCDLPAGAQALARRLVTAVAGDGVPLAIVPGLRRVDARGDPDVMRGEETQLIGAAIEGRPDGVFVHPGTHSKWALMAAGEIRAFSTFMTGELHAALLGHTILGAFQQAAAASASAPTPASAAAAPDWQAFERGVTRAHACDDFTHALFTVRSRVLEADLSPASVPDYLSGLLIGEEFRGARAAGWLPEGAHVTLIGDERLTVRYARAMDLLDVSFAHGPADVVVPGLVAIARHARLIPDAGR